MENKIAIFKDAETILEVPVSTEEKQYGLTDNKCPFCSTGM